MHFETLSLQARNMIVGKVLGVPGADEYGCARHLMHPLRRIAKESLASSQAEPKDKGQKKEKTPLTAEEKDFLVMSSTCKKLRESCMSFAHQVVANRIEATFDKATETWTVSNIQSSSQTDQLAGALLVSLNVEAAAEDDFNVLPSIAKKAIPAAVNSLASRCEALQALSLSSKQALVWMPAILDALPGGRTQLVELDAVGILDLTKYKREFVPATTYKSAYDESLEALSGCKRLQSLKLSGHPKLSIFDLKGLNPPAFGALDSLRELDRLEELAVSHYPLAKLYIPHVLAMMSGRQPEPEPFEWASLPSGLRRLTLEHVLIGDDYGVLNLIESVRSTLEILEVTDCPLPPWEGPSEDMWLPRMTALKDLKLSQVGKPDVGWTNEPTTPETLLNFTSPILRTLIVENLDLDRFGSATISFFLAIGLEDELEGSKECDSELDSEQEEEEEDTPWHMPTLKKVHLKGSCGGLEKSLKRLEMDLAARGVDTAFNFTFVAGGGSGGAAW